MPRLNQVCCVLAVVDHRASAEFYLDKILFGQAIGRAPV